MRKLVLLTALATLGVGVPAAYALPATGLQTIAAQGQALAGQVQPVTWGHRHHYGYYRHHYWRPYYYSHHYHKPWYGHRYSYWHHRHYRHWHH